MNLWNQINHELDASLYFKFHSLFLLSRLQCFFLNWASLYLCFPGSLSGWLSWPDPSRWLWRRKVCWFLLSLHLLPPSSCTSLPSTSLLALFSPTSLTSQLFSKHFTTSLKGGAWHHHLFIRFKSRCHLFNQELNWTIHFHVDTQHIKTTTLHRHRTISLLEGAGGEQYPPMFMI